MDGNLTLICEVGSNDKVLVFDNSTGLLHDQIITNFSGAYCYSNQQTEWAWDFGQALLDAKDDILDFILNNSFMDWANNDILGIVGSISMSVGVSCLPAFPIGTVVGLGLIGFGLYSTYYADDLNKGLNLQRGANFGLDVGLSLLPFVGSGGKVIKTLASSDAVLGKIVLSKGASIVSNKIVTKSSFAFEQYLVEKGESELLYNGLTRVSTKFGTLESAYRTVYGNTYIEQIKSIGKDLLKSKTAHYFFDNFYDLYFN